MNIKTSPRAAQLTRVDDGKKKKKKSRQASSFLEYGTSCTFTQMSTWPNKNIVIEKLVRI